MQQAASLTDLADKPLIVLTAGRGHDAEWMAAQDKLATLSTNSLHRSRRRHPRIACARRNRRRRSQPGNSRRRRGGTDLPDRSPRAEVVSGTDDHAPSAR